MRLGAWLVLAAVSAVPLATLALRPVAAETAPPRFVHVVILHTNDMHGQALAIRQRGKARGGFVALARAIERERIKARAIGCEPLLVDAGDIWVGPPEGSRTEGRFVVSVMNALRYDVVELGNHELDHGPEKAAELTALMSFPLLGANVKETRTRRVPRWLHASAVRERAGLPIRFVGLLTSKIHEVTTPSATVGLDVEEEAKALDEALAGCPAGEVTIALTHCGHEVDRELAKRFHGALAAIVGGHTHRVLDPAWHVPEGARDAVLIAQTGARTENLGRIDLDVDRRSNQVLRAEETLIPIVPEEGDAASQPAIARMVEAEVQECNKLLGVKVGSVEHALVRAPRQASNLGSVICDAIREARPLDLSFTNPHGLRADIPAGDVLLRNLYEVDPFENTLVTMTFTGTELRALLEEMCAVEPLESSGLELRYDSRLPKGKRILDVKVGGKPLDPARVYKVGTNNFLAGGGDKYEHFRRGQDVVNTQLPVREIVRGYFEKRGRVPEPFFAERVVNVAPRER